MRPFRTVGSLCAPKQPRPNAQFSVSLTHPMIRPNACSGQYLVALRAIRLVPLHVAGCRPCYFDRLL